VIHESAQGETIVIENNPENRVKPQFGLNPRELAEQYPEEPIPAILIDCVEILKNGGCSRWKDFFFVSSLTTIFNLIGELCEN
jgi:hypothetical protein